MPEGEGRKAMAAKAKPKKWTRRGPKTDERGMRISAVGCWPGLGLLDVCQCI